MCLSAKGQEPNQFVSNQMHHKQPCSQRTKYRKRWGGSGDDPLGPEHNDCHTGLRAQEGRLPPGPLITYLSPHPQGLGGDLVWSCKVAASLPFHDKETEAQNRQVTVTWGPKESD